MSPLRCRSPGVNARRTGPGSWAGLSHGLTLKPTMCCAIPFRDSFPSMSQAATPTGGRWKPAAAPQAPVIPREPLSSAGSRPTGLWVLALIFRKRKTIPQAMRCSMYATPPQAGRVIWTYRHSRSFPTRTGNRILLNPFVSLS